MEYLKMMIERWLYPVDEFECYFQGNNAKRFLNEGKKEKS